MRMRSPAERPAHTKFSGSRTSAIEASQDGIIDGIKAFSHNNEFEIDLGAFSTTLSAKESIFDLFGDGVAVKSRAGAEDRIRIHVADSEDGNLIDLIKKFDLNQIQLSHSRTETLYLTYMTPSPRCMDQPVWLILLSLPLKLLLISIAPPSNSTNLPA